ncbi:MAG: anion permease [Proteobacteria bacterium]|nr:anion permease [Pseudomonadota bacterium]
MIVGGLMLQLPVPDGLTGEGWIILTMSVVSVILFVTEPVPLPTVALLIIIGQVVLMGHASSDVAKSLMNDSVLFIAGSLMLAVAVVKQKLDKRIAWLIVRMTGTRTWRVCFGITVVSGLLASFVGEHTVAAMMLPVGITLITLTSDDPKKVRNLAAVLLFSIAYGASVAGIGTPSGGARNAIMIGYWKEFFYDPGNPETYKFLVGYVDWMIHAYPMFLIQVPFVTAILFWTFRPEYRDLSRAVVKLRKMIEEEGPMKAADWMSILIFFLVLLGWILISGEIGMGTVAVAGAAMFLVAGLVRWEDINGARVIVETQMRDIKVTPSEGTHFFQNITASKVGYITISSESRDSFVDWEWLEAQPAVEERKYVRHIRFEENMSIMMDGHHSNAVILKPGVNLSNGSDPE